MKKSTIVVFNTLRTQAILLFITAVIIRAAEIAILKNAHFNDINTDWGFWVFLLSGEAFFILLYLLTAGVCLAIISVKFPVVYKIIFAFIYVILVALYITGAQFYYTTQMFLDHLIFYFSIPEIKTIIKTEVGNVYSEYASLYIISLLLTLIVLCIHFFRNRLNKWPVLLNIILTVFLLSALTGVFIPEDSLPSRDSKIVISKPHIFIRSVVNNFLPEDGISDLNTAVTKYREFYEFPHYSVHNEYPLLQSFDIKNNELGKYFNEFDGPPNIILIFCEGLSASFSGSNAFYGSLTPHMDSIFSRSLYWPNALSNTDRTHGVFANVLSSLPHGQERGVLNLRKKPYPEHFSLSKWLILAGYDGGFIYGGWAYFDNYEPFLRANYINKIYGKKFFQKNYKTSVFKPVEEYSWGIQDKDLFQNYFNLKIDDKLKPPYLGIFLTQSLHSPFEVPNQEKYINLARERFSKVNSDSALFERKKKIWASIIYADEAIGEFFKEFREHPEFSNSIILLVGDHNLHALPYKNDLDRFHVPLAIYSSKLKQAKVFKNIVAHTDIPGSLLKLIKPYLKDAALPSHSSWISQGLGTSNKFYAETPLFLGSFKGEITGMVNGRNLLLGNRFYQIEKGMKLTEIKNDERKEEFTDVLNAYRAINRYVLDKNKLMLPLDSMRFSNHKADFYFPK